MNQLRNGATFLLPRPLGVCRCQNCIINIQTLIESATFEPTEPKMIPTFNNFFGWWNVRLPSKELDLTPQPYTDVAYIDDEVMKFLENKKVINWCPAIREFYPIRTLGDGNCLMHAVILATCGQQDCGLVLRRLVYIALVEAKANTFCQRWRRERERLNDNIPGGLEMTSTEWEKEWNLVVSAAEDLRQPSHHSSTYSSYAFLEEMHVFVLANVLRRPIIILGESTVCSPLEGDSLEQNNFVGIYLPLLWEPLLCDPNPIVLCFLRNHFQPLITRCQLSTKETLRFAVPLVNSKLEPLHIHFLLGEEYFKAHVLLQHYLYTAEVLQKSEDGKSEDVILVAELSFTAEHGSRELEDYIYLMTLYSKYSKREIKNMLQLPSSVSLDSYLNPSETQKSLLGTPVACEKHGVAHHQITEGATSDTQIFKSLTPVSGNRTDKLSKFQTSSAEDDDEQLELCPGCKKRHLTKSELNSMLTQLKSSRAVLVTRKGNGLLEQGKGPHRVTADSTDDEYVKLTYSSKAPIYWRNSSLISKPCTKPGCKNFATRKNDPHCKDHGQRLAITTVADKLGIKVPSPCKHCQNQGPPHYGGVCQKCHKYKHSHDAEKKCICPICQGQGQPQYGGLCQKCYNYKHIHDAEHKCNTIGLNQELAPSETYMEKDFGTALAAYLKAVYGNKEEKHDPMSANKLTSERKGDRNLGNVAHDLSNMQLRYDSSGSEVKHRSDWKQDRSVSKMNDQSGKPFQENLDVNEVRKLPQNKLAGEEFSLTKNTSEQKNVERNYKQGDELTEKNSARQKHLLQHITVDEKDLNLDHKEQWERPAYLQADNSSSDLHRLLSSATDLVASGDESFDSVNTESSKCQNLMCGNLASGDSGVYCSLCSQTLINREGSTGTTASNKLEMKESGPQSSSTTILRAEKCFNGACDRYGDPSFNGFCSVCWKYPSNNESQRTKHFNPNAS